MLFGCHLENSNTILQRHKRIFGYSDIFGEFLFENKNTAFVFFSPRLNQGEQQKFNEKKNNKSIEFILFVWLTSFGCFVYFRKFLMSRICRLNK